jgi:hypothetical protein
MGTSGARERRIFCPQQGVPWDWRLGSEFGFARFFGEGRVMSGAKGWEVCLYSDFTDYRVWCKNFRSRRRARRFLRKELGGTESFYCATVSNEENSAFRTYYWNGRAIVPWDKPWVLSRRQALELEGNGRSGPDF